MHGLTVLNLSYDSLFCMNLLVQRINLTSKVIFYFDACHALCRGIHEHIKMR